MYGQLHRKVLFSLTCANQIFMFYMGVGHVIFNLHSGGSISFVPKARGGHCFLSTTFPNTPSSNFNLRVTHIF